MLYATFYQHSVGDCGHVGNKDLEHTLNTNYSMVTKIQADGDELVKCCEILGRQLPKKRVYTFLGNNAQEIAKNWDSK